ncbi:MAG: RcpC/CpaB family pilus assembly protein [Acidimicrobiales bacterium]
MARNRSTALIAVGAAVFVVGAALTFLLVRDDGDDSKVRASAPAASTSTAAAAQSTAGSTVPQVKVPAGKEAVAVQVATVPGLAGYAKIGDRVNVYGIFKDRQPNSPARGLPLTKLVLADASVLARTGPPVGAESGSAIYLLAVNPGDAEKVVYLTTFEGIYLSITAEGDPAITNTPGRNSGNAI